MAISISGLLGSFFPNEDGSRNALQRFSDQMNPEDAAIRQQAEMERKQQSALAALMPKLQSNNPQEKQSALMELATINPQKASALAQFMPQEQKPEYKVQEIGGQLVRFNPNDPNAKPEVIFGGDGTKKPDVKGEGELRKEFEGMQKDFRQIQGAYNRLSAATENPSAAGDIALIFNYMKMLDPGSTVREGEFATAQNAAGIPDIVRNYYNRAKNGERLNPAQREDFVSQAQNIYKSQLGLFNQSADKYRGLAQEYGYDPDRITKTVDVPKTKYKEGQRAKLPDGRVVTFTGGKWQ